MPNEKDIIYCTCIDETGNIISTSMLTQKTAERNLELLKESEVCHK